MGELIIGARYNGPPATGNGGYTAGLVAQQLPPAASGRSGSGARGQAAGHSFAVGAGEVRQVTLRTPPPLDTPLQVSPRDSGGIVVYAGSRLVAEAAPVALSDGQPAPPVSAAEAAAATAAYPGFVDHPFPTCYVCGPRRPAGDGLRIFPGRLPDGRTAAPWRVPAGCTELMVWAALDCPGGWAVLTPGRVSVLGRMAASVDVVPPAGADCLLVGEVTATEGRKSQVRTALYGGPAGSDLLAWARATWIAIGGAR